jgi:GNAT superfamily N-acetyltransferase
LDTSAHEACQRDRLAEGPRFLIYIKARLMASRQDSIERAIEVFVRGFCFGRSRTHPYEFSKITGIWWMRDAPRRNERNYRKEEWVAYGIEPAKVDAIALEHTRGRYAICALRAEGESDETMCAEYKRIGYRLLVTEPLFVHHLKRIPRAASPVKIARVRTSEMAAQFAKATRSRPIPPQDLTSKAPFRQYVALDGEQIVGWVRSVRALDSAWVSDMYVLASHRRRGIGFALLTKMLRDDRAEGAKSSVLLSSHTGALLYPKAGYEQIGVMYIFMPRKS